jgi:MinD superfamily P-loop ATPase
VCQGCGTCVRTCPVEAIDFPERRCGEWIVSDTRCGPMVHAQLNLAAENSAELVSTIRREAHRIALKENRSLVIVNSPSGIGFPVAASVLGASYVLVVTEPTAFGEHDLEAALSLARRHNIPAAVCVNNWDLNVKMTEQIEEKARRRGAQIAGRIRCDRAVTFAEIHERAVMELDSPAAADIRRLWEHMIHNAFVGGVIGMAEP